MSSTVLRTRLLTAGGGMLVAAGLAATMITSTAAHAATAGVQADAEVASSISITADDASFTLAGAPGDTAVASSGLTVVTNNTAGYDVSVQADAATLSGAAAGNTDTIPIAALYVKDSAAALVTASNVTPITVHSQATKSAEAGDAITADYQMTIPFVNSDTYSIGLTFTAAPS